MSELITNRLFSITLDSSGSGSFTYTFPQNVSELTVKSIAYNPASGTALYGVLSSNLVNWYPLGIVYRQITTPYTPAELKYKEFNTLSTGLYTVQMKNLDGTIASSCSGDVINIILEFKCVLP